MSGWRKPKLRYMVKDGPAEKVMLELRPKLCEATKMQTFGGEDFVGEGRSRSQSLEHEGAGALRGQRAVRPEQRDTDELAGCSQRGRRGQARRGSLDFITSLTEALEGGKQGRNLI